MARLTPDAESPSSSAARVKLPRSTTVARTVTPESTRASIINSPSLILVTNHMTNHYFIQ
jgi:hypothetical protein